MGKSLYINISKERVNWSGGEKDTDLLDISNTIKFSSKIDVGQFVEKQEVLEYGLSLYREFIDQLILQIDLDRFLFLDIPIYWLTDVSEKHPIYHWGKYFFLLIGILEQKKERIIEEYDQLTLNLPIEIRSFDKGLKDFLRKLFNDRMEFNVAYSGSLPSALGFISQLKVYLRYFKMIKSSPKINTIIEGDIFIGSFARSNQKDKLYNSIKELYSKNDQSVTTIPNDFTKHHPMPKTFLKYSPSLYQFLKLFFTNRKAFSKVRRFRFDQLEVKMSNGLILNCGFLNQEFSLALSKNAHLFIYYKWFERFFSKLEKPAKIIYEDEFYQYGRILSIVSKKFPKLQSYGIQHGNFDGQHTVYGISTCEIENGIPLPDFFIGWGGFYNNKFFENISMPRTKLLPLGNPAYVNRYITRHVIEDSSEILWCLTTKECFDFEWRLMKEKLKRSNSKLKIRLHPAPHITEQDVKDEIGDDLTFSFSNESSITEAILKSSMVIVSAHSTTFVDAISHKKPCIRLLSRYYNGDPSLDFNCLRTVSRAEQFEEAFTDLINLKQSEVDFDTIVELDDEKWKQFLNPN